MILILMEKEKEKDNGIYVDIRFIYILLGPPGCAQASPYLSPGLLDFFGGMKTANKPHASRNYTQDH